MLLLLLPLLLLLVPFHKISNPDIQRVNATATLKPREPGSQVEQVDGGGDSAVNSFRLKPDGEATSLAASLLFFILFFAFIGSLRPLDE